MTEPVGGCADAGDGYHSQQSSESQAEGAWRATQADTRSILDHQYEAFSAGSADEVIKDFAEDAVLIRADKVFEGRDQVHAAYSEMFARLFKPGTYEFTLDAEHVIRDIAYIAWHASCASDEITLGADTFMVRNGKIVAQTYTAKVEPKTA